MRKIDTVHASTFGHGMGNIRHARNYAARLCAELHLLGHAGTQIQQTNWHEVGSGLFPSTYCNYDVYSDAPQDVVDKAQEAHTFTGDGPFVERLKAWALTEWYGQSWVTASRLFACLYTLDESVDWHNYVWAARWMFGQTAQRAFAHELAQTAKETGTAYGPFYFGTKWPSPKKA